MHSAADVLSYISSSVRHQKYLILKILIVYTAGYRTWHALAMWIWWAADSKGCLSALSTSLSWILRLQMKTQFVLLGRNMHIILFSYDLILNKASIWTWISAMSGAFLFVTFKYWTVKHSVQFHRNPFYGHFCCQRATDQIFLYIKNTRENSVGMRHYSFPSPPYLKAENTIASLQLFTCLLFKNIRNQGWIPKWLFSPSG